MKRTFEEWLGFLVKDNFQDLDILTDMIKDWEEERNIYNLADHLQNVQGTAKLIRDIFKNTPTCEDNIHRFDKLGFKFEIGELVYLKATPVIKLVIVQQHHIVSEYGHGNCYVARQYGGDLTRFAEIELARVVK